MEQDAAPLEIILQEIEHAIASRMYYLAIAISLSLPDICGALEDNGWATGAKYEAWFDQNVAPHYEYLRGHACYKLRSGVLHQAQPGQPGDHFKRVYFILPTRRNNVLRESVHNQGETPETAHIAAIGLSAVEFCQQMVASVRTWYIAKKDEPNMVTNLPNLLQFRPMGLFPFYYGAPVIG